MNNTLTKPCATWATLLAARHPSDLSEKQSAALRAHLQTCPACASAYAAYAQMEMALLQLPPVTPLVRFNGEQVTEEVLDTKPQAIGKTTLLSNHLSAAHGRQPRLVRAVNLLAAVLVVCLLLGGFLVLYSLHRQTTSSSTPQPSCQAEKQLDPTMLTHLCQQNLLTDINQPQTSGGDTITLTKAYVDANEVLFEYTTHRSSTGEWIPSQLKTLSVVLQTSSGPIALGGGPNGTSFFQMIAPNASPHLPDVISVQNSGEFPQNVQVYHVQIGMTVTPQPTSSAPITASFSFSLTFHAGQTIDEQQIINGTNVYQQTVTASGISLALFKTMVSPSMVALYVRVPALSDTFDSYTLYFNGTRVEASSIAHAPSALPTSQPPYFVFSFFTSQVFNQHGTLTLTIDSVNGHSGPWTFLVSLS